MKRKSLPTGRDFLFVEGYGNENPGAFQSTRPLRGATRRRCRKARTTSISTHAPLAGRDSVAGYSCPFTLIFQPTRPLRGATSRGCCRGWPYEISTHAPLAGRDKRISADCRIRYGFQPTRPLRGATVKLPIFIWSPIFQPTRPLRGATRRTNRSPLGVHFNPRAPCGARQQKCTNHYAHFCDNRQISDVFAQNADCQGILFLFCARKTCKF